MALEELAPLQDVSISETTTDAAPCKSRNRDLPKTPLKPDGKENVQPSNYDTVPTPSPIKSSRTYDRWCRPRSEDDCRLLGEAKEAGGELGLQRAIEQLDAAAVRDAAAFALAGIDARPDEDISSIDEQEDDSTDAWYQPQSLRGLDNAAGFGWTGEASTQADDNAAADEGQKGTAAAKCDALLLYASLPKAQLVAAEDPVSDIDSVAGGCASTAGNDLADGPRDDDPLESQHGYYDLYVPFAPAAPSRESRKWQAAVQSEIWRKIKEQPHDAAEIRRRDEWIERTWIPENARRLAMQQAMRAQNDREGAAAESNDRDSDGDVFGVPKGRKRAAADDEEDYAEPVPGSVGHGAPVAKRSRVQLETAAGTPPRRARSEAASPARAAPQTVSIHTATVADTQDAEEEQACPKTLADQDTDDEEDDGRRGGLNFSASAEH